MSFHYFLFNYWKVWPTSLQWVELIDKTTASCFLHTCHVGYLKTNTPTGQTDSFDDTLDIIQPGKDTVNRWMPLQCLC